MRHDEPIRPTSTAAHGHSFKDPATTYIYTLTLPAALPISNTEYEGGGQIEEGWGWIMGNGK